MRYVPSRRHVRSLLGLSLIVTGVLAGTSVQHLSAQTPASVVATSPGSSAVTFALTAGGPQNVTGQIAETGTFDPAGVHNVAAPAAVTPVGPRVVPFHSVTAGPHAASAAKTSATAANVAGAQLNILPGFTYRNFEGISAVDNAAASGAEDTPPDEGGCASNQYVGEIVNTAVRFIDGNTGTPLGPDIAMPTFFGLPLTTFTSDPRCLYDAPTHSWFASVLSQDSGGNSFVQLAVNTKANPYSAWTIYSINVTNDDGGSGGAPCSGDQPLLGVDAYLVVLQSNQYCNNLNTFVGGYQFALSKTQLLAGNASPNAFMYGAATCNALPCGSFLPASSSAAANATMALYSTLTLDPYGTGDTAVGVQAFTKEANIDLATPQAPVWSGWGINGQNYVTPVQARQWGSPFPIEPDDDRMVGVSFVNNTLWSTAGTAVTPTGDTAVRDGAAWWAITPHLDGTNTSLSGLTLNQQGILATKGQYILYPAIAAVSGPAFGAQAVLAFEITGQNHFLSAAYSVQSTHGLAFPLIAVFGAGSTALANFDAQLVPNLVQMRAGDYSLAVPVPGTNRFLIAAEYANAETTATYTNWDNRLAEITVP